MVKNLGNSSKAFAYFGSTVTGASTSEREANILIAKATRVLSRLRIIWRSRNVKTKTKLILLLHSCHFDHCVCVQIINKDPEDQVTAAGALHHACVQCGDAQVSRRAHWEMRRTAGDR